MKKMYAYRFMVPGIGTLQEGFFEARSTGHAKRKAQRICREDVLSSEMRGKWSRWGQRGRVYGCSFLDERTGRYGYRLVIIGVATDSIPENSIIPELLPAAWE